MQISFMSANFVARQVNYQMTEGWMQGDDATNAWFAPIATYEMRFGKMLQEVAELGFNAIDIWLPHLNPSWATAEHISIAKEQLEKNGLRVASLAGWFGNSVEEVAKACRLARALGAGGST